MLNYFRLQAVQNRPGIRAPLAEKFVEIFNWYEADLEEVHKIYETHKVSDLIVTKLSPVRYIFVYIHVHLL